MASLQRHSIAAIGSLANRSSVVILIATILSGLVGHALAPTAAAFCDDFDPSFRLQENVYRAHIQDFIPNAWEPAMVAAVNQWNNVSALNLQPVIDSPAYWNFNIDARDLVANGWADAPGTTKQYGVDFFTHHYNQADMSLNQTWSWNLLGNMNKIQRVADVRTVTVHEVGHGIGLQHPIDCGQPYTNAEKAAAMTAAWVKRWNTQSDDDAGSLFKYP